MTSVNVYPHHEDASAQYRIILPGLALEAAGYDVQVIMPDAAKADPQAVRGSDVAVMSRPDTPAAIDMIVKLREMGTRVIVDMDDRLDLVSPHHIMSPVAPVLHQFAIAGCLAADRVTASTPTVAYEYATSKADDRTLVLRNRVPQKYVTMRRSEPAKTVGWSGTVATHPRDLQETGGMVAKELDWRKDWQFRCIGPQEEANTVCSALGLKFMSVSGWIDFETYPVALSQIGVGIVPLRLTRFNDAKSSLKMLEMAALGVRVIASPTKENTRLHREYGIGHLAKLPTDWRRQLRFLLSSDERNTDAFPFALTIEGSLEQWREAWWL
jgi:hypothetical protein